MTHTQSVQNLFTFAPRLLTWFETHGRHDLPWQYHHKPTADIYAVWLSEIMLQQTQVATVLGYFPRFMAKFPTVQDLARADWDEVAELWAGLGYYARARNLHAGAKQVADFIEQNGHFPQTTDDWQTIKGVGRSTAGAIVAMGVRGRGVICDGNVKRVLTRWVAIDGDITKTATDKVLWTLAETLTPDHDSGKFAQAMMDMGATICTRTRPQCEQCPLSTDCLAYQNGNPTAYPVKAKKADKPHRYSLAIALIYNEKILWLKRHSAKAGGIWEGLWSLPLLGLDEPITDLTFQAYDFIELLSHHQGGQFHENQLFELLATLPSPKIELGKNIKHTLTHFHWHLTLTTVQIDDDFYHKINDLLKNIHADFDWQAPQNPLAKPKGMDKLFD